MSGGALDTVTPFPMLGGVININGLNPTITAVSAPEDIWQGSAPYPFPTVVADTTIESSSANDAAAGTGARTVKVTGLDANYDIVVETVAMNGVTPVALSTQLLRINDIEVMTAGSGGTTAGNLSVKQAATTIGFVAAGFNRNRASIYTIPNKYIEGQLLGWHASLKEATAAVAFATLALQTKTASGLWYAQSMIHVNVASPSIVSFPVPISIPTHADIRVRALSVIGTIEVISCVQLGLALSDA